MGQESGSYGTEQETAKRRRTTLGIGEDRIGLASPTDWGGTRPGKPRGKYFSQENYTSEAINV